MWAGTAAEAKGRRVRAWVDGAAWLAPNTARGRPTQQAMRQAMRTLRQVSRRQHDSRLRHNEGTQADPPPGNPPASGSWAQAPAPLWAPATWCAASWSSRAAPLGRWRALQEGPGRRRECAGRKAAARRHRRRRAPAGSPTHSAAPPLPLRGQPAWAGAPLLPPGCAPWAARCRLPALVAAPPLRSALPLPF